MKTRLNRRDFLKAATLAGGGLALAACAPAAAPAAPANTEAPAAAPANKEPTALLYWFQAENHKPEYDRRQKEIEDKFNVKLTFELLSRDAMTKKFPTTLMAGSGFPDIIEQNADDIVKFLKGEDNVIPFVGMDNALASSPYASDVLENRWARYTKGGKKYGAPHDVHPIIMLYNDTEWKKFGVDMSTVKTYDDYLAAFSKMDKTMPDGTPRIGNMDCLGCATLLSMMLQNGVWWTDTNDEPQLTNPAFKKAVETWFKFKDYWVDIDWANDVAMMKKGQIMTQFLPDWFYGIYKQGLKGDDDFKKTTGIRAMRIPYFTETDCRTGSWGGTAASVPKLSKIVDLAMNVLLYTYFDNTQKQLEARFTDLGLLPPVKSVWESDLLKAKEDILGGQPVGPVFVEAAKQLPKYQENWKTSLITTAWGDQQALAWAGKISIDEAIATADKTAKENIDKAA
jgi:arabinosaccharide transport system substrate-binding protein